LVITETTQDRLIRESVGPSAAPASDDMTLSRLKPVLRRRIWTKSSHHNDIPSLAAFDHQVREGHYANVDDALDWEEQLEPGMHLLTKPFSMDELAGRIKRVITD
jgi:hypothetical protein